MKIIHMADSHLGFTSFSRVDKYGNLVEEMVYKGFEQAINKIIEIKPDAVVHAEMFSTMSDPGSGHFISSSAIWKD